MSLLHTLDQLDQSSSQPSGDLITGLQGNLLLSQRVVLERHGCLCPGDGRGKDVVKTKLARKDVFHDMYCMAYAGLRVSIQHICSYVLVSLLVY